MSDRHLLLLKTGASHVALLAIMALLAFGPNPSPDYWQALIFLPLFVGASLALNLYLARQNPELLARRLSIGPIAEKEPAQRYVMLFILLNAMALVAIPALDSRMNWSHVPAAFSLIGDLLVLGGWLVIFLVFRENAFASATIELAPDQRVIATGPYAYVRHPMYAGALLMLVGAPLALGSWWGLIPAAGIAAALIVRIVHEEKFLVAHLDGYAAYRKKTPARLLPAIW